MYRTFVILRHTFLEAILQPIYSVVMALGAVILLIFTMLPFFTLGEDTKMFKAVGLDVVLLLVLISTLFATSKSIFEEIEDRTMLTLMSKPVRKWQVLVGKYLGIILSALLAITILGGLLTLCLCWRIPGDAMLRTNSLDDREITQIYDLRLMHSMGLLASLVLMWFQISVLAAIGVAISTRFSLVVNLPTVILIYIAGNLTRFLLPLNSGAVANRSSIARALAYGLSVVLPFLQTFDLKQKTVYAPIALAGTMFAQDVRAVTPGEIWRYVAVAGLYALLYTVFALTAGMLLFQNRELGGSEG